MKQALSFLLIAVTLFSCDHKRGSGNIISQNRTVSNFSVLSISGSFDVEVKVGTATEVKIEADDNIINDIETNVSGNTLRIRLQDRLSISNAHLKVFITVPTLTAIKASASAEVDVLDKIVSIQKLTFMANSSAEITTEVDAPEIEADASSSATIKLRGRTKNYSADASSSADIESSELLSENTKANASSSATVKVHASVSLQARSSSSGEIIYRGEATVSQSVSSSGSVTKER